jgi:hypothetical protein
VSVTHHGEQPSFPHSRRREIIHGKDKEELIT